MSAQQFPFAPEPGAREAQPSVEGQAGENKQVNGASETAGAHLSIDPQQQFREFTAPLQHTVPAGPPPVMPQAPGSVQPGHRGQAQMQPGVQPGYAGQVPPGTQPGFPGQVPAGVQPGYMAQAQGPVQPGYPAQPGFPGQIPPGVQPGYPAQAQGPVQPGFPQPGYPVGPVPSGAQPGYAPYGGYTGSPYAAYPGYPGYPPYGYGWVMVPEKPKRDGYLLGVGIAAFVASCLVILGGFGSLALLGLVDLATSVLKNTISNGSFFATVMLLLTFALAGIVGGSFCLYHSIRSLFLRKTSRVIWLPRFWIFLLCYLATLGLGYWLHTQDLDVGAPALTGVLIYLAGIFPALMIMALGIRRVSMSRVNRQKRVREPGASESAGQRLKAVLARFWQRLKTAPQHWPTSWRRLTLALVSGATLGIGLALILEFIFELIIAGSAGQALSQYLNNPDAGTPPPSLYGLVLLLFAVIAPLVEEMAKPLAVVVLIGRVRSKAEAFVLGLACGIGFDLIETTGYISTGYQGWLGVALARSGAGLLHGFGAAMVALSWYYLTHKEEGTWPRRILLALGCAGYAVLQHGLWNGAVGLLFIPGPIGDFFQNWSWSYGPFALGGVELVYIVESIGILTFFIYMTGRLRTRSNVTQSVRTAENAPQLVEQSMS